MQTIFNKVGHKKIPVEAIREKELEILRALGFKVGSFASSFEFLERYVDGILSKHSEREFIKLMATYLAKMSLHHENLCTKQSSL
jgi:hypothetical protein